MSLFLVYKSLFSGVFIFDLNNQLTSRDLPFPGTPNMTANVTNDTIIHIFNGGYTTNFFIPCRFILSSITIGYRRTHHTKNVINANRPAENIITSVFSTPVVNI